MVTRRWSPRAVRQIRNLDDTGNGHGPGMSVYVCAKDLWVLWEIATIDV